MLGQPDPILPVSCKEPVKIGSQAAFKRAGYVSVWIGTFESVEDAEAYFGIPDEIGVYLPAQAFADDFSLGNFPPDTLEVNFEQVLPRPIMELLRDATFAGSFLDLAIEAAARQGIGQGQGVALLYDFDYRLNSTRRDAVGTLQFIGAFPFVRCLPHGQLANRSDD